MKRLLLILVATSSCYSQALVGTANIKLTDVETRVEAVRVETAAARAETSAKLEEVRLKTEEVRVETASARVETSAKLEEVRVETAAFRADLLGSMAVTNSRLNPRGIESAWVRVFPSTGVVSRNATASDFPLLSVRLKTGSVGYRLVPEELSLAVGTAVDVRCELRLNAGLTGAAFASGGTNFDQDVSATAATGGTLVDVFFLVAEAAGRSERRILGPFMPILTNPAGTSDVLTLVVRPIVGGTTATYASISLREIAP